MAHNNEAGGSGGAITRPLNFTVEEAEVLATHHVLVPPGWRLPSGWRVSASGYAVRPLPASNTAEFARLVQTRREALRPEDRALPEFHPSSGTWLGRLMREHQREVDDYILGVSRYNAEGRARWWQGRNVDEELARYGFEPRRRFSSRRGRSAPTASVSRSGSSDDRSVARSAPYPLPRRSTNSALVKLEAAPAPPASGGVKIEEEEEIWEEPPPEALEEGDTRPWFVQEACLTNAVARHPDDPEDSPGMALALANSLAEAAPRSSSGGAAPRSSSGGAAARSSGGGASTSRTVVDLVSDEEEEDVKPLLRRRGYGGGH